MKLLSLMGASFNELSKKRKVKLIGKGCSYVVLSLISDGMVRLGSMLR